MQQKEMSGAERYTRQNHRRRTWQKVVGTLACVVVFCTTYALILPAITQENTVYCALEEHVHTDACYAHAEQTESAQEVQFAPEPSEVSEVHEAQVSQLVCTYETLNVHTHSEDCFDADGNYLCGKADYVAHSHDSSCYDQSGTLVCQLPERSSHIHSESCYAVTEGHTHSETCYETRRGDLICTLEETDGQEATEDQEAIEAHHHSDDCYTWQSVLVCGLEESESTSTLICTEPAAETHVHSESCFLTTEVTEELPEPEMQEPAEPEAEGSAQPETSEPVETEDILICGLEEHTHSIACYSNPNADLETAEDWEQTLARAELTGVWAEDVIAIAETQLGYTESTVNYQVAEDGTLQGITRYGQWYGDPYGDWCAMFVSFCLDYAQVEGMPLESSCARWIEALTEAGLYQAAPDYTPVAGDLIFFDTDQDGLSDHMGLAVEIFENGTIKVIEGNSGDRVQYVEYELTDETILGFGLLPEQETEEEITTFTLSAETGSGIVVTVTGESTSLPFPAEEITLTAADVISEEASAIQDHALEEAGLEPEQNFLLDITLWHGEEIVEPVGPVTVTFGGLETEGYYPKVYHIDTETEDVTDMEAVSDEGGNPVISTDHFSVYGVMLLAAPEGMAIYYNTSQLNSLSSTGTNRYYLAQNIMWGEEVPINGNITLDLNGHNIEFNTTSAHFLVKSGASLTIIDSSVTQSDVTVYNPSSTLYNNLASYSDSYSAVNSSDPSASNSNTVTLNYFVTRSSANSDGISTTETLERRQMVYNNAGVIHGTASGSDNVIIVEGGTLNIQGGCIFNEKGSHSVVLSTNSGGTISMSGGVIHGAGSSSEGSGVYIGSGTFNMTGGYIVGGKSAYGGGIYMNSGTINISDSAVIAANTANSGGGIYTLGGNINMSGGIVSGNTTNNNIASVGQTDSGFGGGIHACNTAITLSGGYITNNCQRSFCKVDGNGCHGGGGVSTQRGSFTMTGGYITGNYSYEAGGGLYIGHYNGELGTTFTLSGGIIASNYCSNSEGGGIRISGYSNAVIRGTSSKVYITNNKMNSDSDWGGGGIFVQQNGNLVVYESLITKNTAGGFGGGVAACPTGNTLIVNELGAAIYDNTANGEHLSGGTGNKDDDTETLGGDSAFQNSKCYRDYYCVKQDGNTDITLIMGEMLGGGAANWEGRIDGSPVTISKTGYKTSQWLCGLTANPSEASKTSAINAASVIISGNSSYTHGGGIMTNGGLILGKVDNVETVCPALDIVGTKALTKDGVSQSSGLENFEFLLLSEKPTLADDQWSYSEGSVIGSAKSDSSGKFTLSASKEYTTTGTYTYYLVEKTDNDPSMDYDETIYEIKVTVASSSTTVLGVTFTSYNVSDVTVTNLSNNVVPTTSTKKNSDESYTLTFKNATFTNSTKTPVSLQITKKSTGTNTPVLSGIDFTLTKNGEATGVTQRTDANGLVTFTDLERGKTYTLSEAASSAYVPAGPWNVTVDSDGKITIEGLDVKQDPSSTTEILNTTTIYNTPRSYELPDTGGTGTEMYMMGGLLLIAVALLYSCGQRRKGERRAVR